MSIYYYEPFYNFDRLFDAFIRPAGQLLQATQDAAISILEPKMDLHEDATRNTVTASLELPGLKKEDVHIDVHGGHLTISGEKYPI